MTADFVVLPELKLTITKIYGVFGDADIEYLYAGLTTDKNFSPNFNRLTDCRGVSKNNASHDAIKKFGRLIAESKNIKRADLFSRDVEKGTFRQYEAYARSSTENVLMTQSVDDAIEWLD